MVKCLPLLFTLAKFYWETKMEEIWQLSINLSIIQFGVWDSALKSSIQVTIFSLQDPGTKSYLYTPLVVARPSNQSVWTRSLAWTLAQSHSIQLESILLWLAVTSRFISGIRKESDLEKLAKWMTGFGEHVWTLALRQFSVDLITVVLLPIV